MKKVLSIAGILMLIFNCATAQQWNLAGNSGTSPGTDFMGTTDNNDIVFKTNNNEILRLGADQTSYFNAGDYPAIARFAGSYWYGQWVYINSNSANSATGSGLRLQVGASNKTQIFWNGGAFSYGTSIDGLVGNTEVVSRAGDVLLSTNSFRTNSLIVKYNTGNVGIGTLSPANKLEITHGTSGNSGLRFTNLTSSSSAGSSSGKVLSLNSSGDVVLEAVPTAADGAETKVSAGTNVTVTGAGTTASPYVVNSSSPWGASGVGTNNIVNSNSGGVMIGTGITGTPSGYKLYVSGGILTEKIKVSLKTSANWADYVFDKQYRLRSLPEVEAYINKYKHLPDMPSAESLVQNGGVDLTDMLAKQMGKIEELTLYIIEMKKEIKALQKKRGSANSGNPVNHK